MYEVNSAAFERAFITFLVDYYRFTHGNTYDIRDDGYITAVRVFASVSNSVHNAAVIFHGMKNKKNILLPEDLLYLYGIRHVDNIIKHEPRLQLEDFIDVQDSNLCYWKAFNFPPLQRGQEDREAYNSKIKGKELGESMNELKRLMSEYSGYSG